jgi:two-component system cell cycle response regulator DivK
MTSVSPTPDRCAKMKIERERPCVLLVEDYPDARAMYRAYLQSSGFDVVEAATGIEALEQAFVAAPDIILMDLSLPEMDGWEAARRLKSDHRTAGIPIVALTGHALAGVAERAKKAGCDAFVTKPCLPQDLVREIRKALVGGVMESSNKRPSVLIVEDHPDARAMYRGYLEAAGFDVVEATDGVEALLRVREVVPDIVLMDLSMPLMDGWEATRFLKDDTRTAGIPVVVLTGYPIGAISEGAMNAGCDVLLTKPCLPKDLVMEIRKVLERSPASVP